MRLRRKLEGDPSRAMNFRAYVRGIRTRSVGDPVPEIPSRAISKEAQSAFSEAMHIGWSLECNGEAFYERVRLHQFGLDECRRISTHFITHRLKLKVNQAKSAVARPGQRKFLGFSFTGEREPSSPGCK